MAKVKIADTEIDKALRWARGKTSFEDANGYIQGYKALHALFENLNFSHPLDVKVAGYAVYGWMPTILKRWDEDHLAELAAFTRDVRSHRSKYRALEQLQSDPLLLKTINNSVVGTSKFLHFASPKIFPIWDAAVAAVFNLKHGNQINNTARYLEYFEVMSDYVETHKKELSSWSPNIFKNTRPTIVRKLEFCLFERGKFLRPKLRKTTP